MSKCSFNVIDFRSHFPIFKQLVHGYPLIYFDSASTAQVPQVVVDQMNQYYFGFKANAGRGVYQFAERATLEYENSRQVVADFINSPSSQNILFTANATASINMVMQSWARHNLKAGDEIIISGVEHHSNLIPWQELSKELKLILSIETAGHDGKIDPTSLFARCTAQTKLVCFVHTSNILGTTNDAQLIASELKKRNIATLVDASQSIAHQPIDVQAMNCDFLVFSGHKLYGPTGIGVVYAASNRIPELKPYQFGGGMVWSVDFQIAQYRPYPHGFEAGSPNIAGAIGLKAAIEFLQQHAPCSQTSQHEAMLVQTLVQGLLKIPSIKMISPIIDSTLPVSLVTFFSTKQHAHDIAAYLDRFGIAVRAGNHCVQPYHQTHGVNASVRVSFAPYNTIEEVQFFLEKLELFLT